MKKPLIIILAIIVFLVPLMQIQQQTAHAAGSKVISLAAKKAAKEFVKDSAIEYAGNLALKALPEVPGLKSDTGFKLVCLDGGKTCDEPLQVKETLTPDDKKQLGDKVEDILDRKAGTTGWVKFLDWFAPIFLIGTAVGYIMYEINNDTGSLFDQVGKEALTEMGFIKPPIFTGESVPVDPNGNPLTPPNSTPKESTTGLVDIPDMIKSNNTVFRNTGLTTSQVTFKYETSYQQSLYTHIQRDIKTQNPQFVSNGLYIGHIQTDGITNNSIELFRGGSNTKHIRIMNIDGQESGSFSDSWQRASIVLFKNNQFVNATHARTQPTMDITAYGLTDFGAITDVIVYPTLNLPGAQTKRQSKSDTSYYFERKTDFKMNNGDVYSVYSYSRAVQQTTQLPQTNKVKYIDYHTSLNETDLGVKITVFNNAEIYTPTPYEVDFTPYKDVSIIDHSRYKVDESTVKITPPNAFPKYDQNGNPIHWNGTEWVTPTGQPIQQPNEDAITVGDPVRTPENDGITVPNGTPTPNKLPDPAPAPDPFKPPAEEPITPEDFEGLSCDVIKKPKFDPLATAVMTSFPFSIPWDIQRIYEALFANVGSERPEFVFKIPGYDQEFPISLNSYFDDWVPFIRSIILLTFDMGLLYAAYRWTKGGSE